ncbi:hypothetical protein [Sphingomonas qomolangmaensis]|uniref:Uncharacterized protein n=1 Tax=Sphingomonas qomolangmaensis TaxID=2918765 RepID=A0ABY5LA25_9SPHN|nr:hypothetical protein [Sphingomonas qomolangmaensis]UUL82898.1 hypothetical protein NMP03_01260 [Sphingomonas qomolangmaensis]
MVFRVLIELFYVLLGLGAAIVIGLTAEWAYPIGAKNIWLVTYAAMVAVVLMGVRPIVRAARGIPR